MTVLVLLDFSKAFDMVSHKKLLVKLANIGLSLPALRFVYPYLPNGLQCVVDISTSTHSKWVKVNTGVLQGSVLGPLLFALIINDICKSLKFSRHMIFADDIQIYLDCFPTEIDRAMNEIRYDVHAISEYANANELQLNLDEIKILIMGSPVYTNATDFNLLPVIVINQTIVPYVQHASSLGVILQPNLLWTK